MRDVLPAIVGGYHLESLLSEHAEGRVHLARDEHGRRVAFKLHQRGAGDATGRAELAVLGLDHPGLAPCLDANRWLGDGRLYTVSEYVDGVPLGPDALAADPSGASERLALAIRLLGALGFLHDQGLLHRDIKEDNVFLSAAREVVLLDFGLCCPLSEAAARPLAGTPRALSPELLQGQPATVASDLWAAGLVLAECLCGRRIFSAGDSAAMLAERVAFESLTAADAERVGDPALVALIERLLQPDPARRPADAQAAFATLEHPEALTAVRVAALRGGLGAALARVDPRRSMLLETLGAGASWVDALGPAGATVSEALGRVAACARSVPHPSQRLSARLAASEAKRTRVVVADVAGLLEAMADAGKLVVSLGTPSAVDEAGRTLREDLARQLEAVPGVETVFVPAPDPAHGAALIEAWIGARPVLAERLAGALPPSFEELGGALGALLRAEAVVTGPEGVAVREDRVPPSWPVASVGELETDLPPEETDLLAVLSVCPRPLPASMCRAVIDRDVDPALARLEERGLVLRVRSHPADLFSPADGRLRRLLAARLPLSAERRVALAGRLVPDGESFDPAWASDLADVLGTQVDVGQDAESTSELVARAADALRRAGRLDRAVLLLRRGVDGASVNSASAERLWLDLIDVLIRNRAYDEARAAIEQARARLPATAVWDVRAARIDVLRGRSPEALATLERIDLDTLADEDALLALQTQLDALHVSGRYDEALVVLREALRRLGDRPHTRALGLLERAGLLEEKLGHYDQAVRHFEAAIAMAQKVGQEVLVGSPTYYMGRAIRSRGEKRRGLALQEEGARQMELAGQRDGVLTALNGLGAGWLTMGQVDAARRHLTRALELARRLGDVGQQAVILNNTGRALFAEGRCDEAEHAFAESMALRAERGDRRGQAIVALTRGPLRLQRGRVDGARDDVRHARELLEGVTAPEWGLEADLLQARIALVESDTEGAAEAAHSARRRAEALGLRREVLIARDLACRAGADDMGDLDGEAEERGPWLADALFSRAACRERASRGDDADQDYSLALAILGETPDGAVEARGLVGRIGGDLRRLEEMLSARELDGGSPDYSAVGKLLSRVSRDSDRARVLVSTYALGPLEQQLNDHAERLGRIEHEGQDVSGLARLAERVTTLERLAEINKMLNGERDTQKLLDIIVDSAIELTGAARGFLILFDGRAEEFRAARNIDESTITDPQFQVSHSVAREVMKSKTSMLTANALDDPRLASASSISELKLLSILCVPLVVRDRSLGAIYLDHPQVVARFRESHLETVLSLAEQAAIALENARLSDGLTRTNDDLRDSQVEVARLNEVLQSRLDQREAELEEVRESLDASRKALGLKYDYARIITRSPRMHEVLDLMDRVIDTHVPVIIQGDSGTGKELIANAIHYNGPRSAQSFVSINCAAIPEPLIESELFGSVKGAFTGADTDRKGLFEQADKGTLFLDEIGDMSLDVQKRLLRVLQEGEFLPVGGRQVRSVDVRILCATHRDLTQMVSEASFREDLYYRLAVAKIRLPPLKDRTEDIALLLPHFIEAHGGEARAVDPEALALLERHEWPGNIREFDNFVMNLLLLDRDGARLTPEHVRRVLGVGGAGRELEIEPEGETLKARLEAFERVQVEQALARTGGNKSAAARELGVGIRTFYKMLARLGL